MQLAHVLMLQTDTEETSTKVESQLGVKCWNIRFKPSVNKCAKTHPHIPYST